MSNENLQRIGWNLRMRLIFFEILSKVTFKCSSKFSLLSKTKPRCFWDSVWRTWELYKVRLGWTSLLMFLLKIASCSSLVISGSNIIFHWYAHWLIFLWSLLSSSVLAAMSQTSEKSDESPANNFCVSDETLWKIVHIN